MEEIFRRIPDKNKWCVEFGAWDGKFMSNCNYFVEGGDWSGIFIESSKDRFKDLIRTYEGNNKVILMNKFVSGSSYGEILIGTETITNRDGTDSNVSSIEIEILQPKKK